MSSSFFKNYQKTYGIGIYLKLLPLALILGNIRCFHLNVLPGTKHVKN